MGHLTSTFFAKNVGILTLPVILSFIIFFRSSNFYKSFFLMVEKLNISAIYKSIILIFSVKEIQTQQLREPREQHLGKVRQLKLN